jgi:hypothetical protein
LVSNAIVLDGQTMGASVETNNEQTGIREQND